MSTSLKIAQGLAGGIQGLSALLNLLTADGIEQQVLDLGSGPAVMGVTMLGSLGQLGLVRAAFKLLIGLQQVHDAKIDVKEIKHITNACVDNVAHNANGRIGLNPRSEQPLLKELLEGRESGAWHYFGARPSRKQTQYNALVSLVAFLLFAFSACATAATNVPICLDRSLISWILAMLCLPGLLCMAVSFAVMRGGVRVPEDIQSSQVQPSYAIFNGASIGYIDGQYKESFPAKSWLWRILASLGSACVLTSFVVSYALFQETDTTRAYIWVGVQIGLVIVRYAVWIFHPLKKLKYGSAEMSAKGDCSVGSLQGLREEPGVSMVILVAAARLKATGNSLNSVDALMARLVLPYFNLDNAFRFLDIDEADGNGEESALLISLSWAVCYAICRVRGIIPSSEPWIGRHARVCVVVTYPLRLLAAISFYTNGTVPPTGQKYAIVALQNGEATLCSQKVYRLSDGRYEEMLGLSVESSNNDEVPSNIAPNRHVLPPAFFQDSSQYLNAVHEWQRMLLQQPESSNAIDSSVFRRLKVGGKIPLDITVQHDSEQVNAWCEGRDIS